MVLGAPRPSVGRCLRTAPLVRTARRSRPSADQPLRTRLRTRPLDQQTAHGLQSRPTSSRTCASPRSRTRLDLGSANLTTVLRRLTIALLDHLVVAQVSTDWRSTERNLAPVLPRRCHLGE